MTRSMSSLISLSIGGFALPYYIDMVAIRAFAAMENGIFVSCAAGKMGPPPGTLLNVALWITTITASTLDRDFPAYVSLGNGMEFFGVSLDKGPSLPKNMLPFVYSGNASNRMDGNLCGVGSLIPEKVAGKIVLCEGWMFNRVDSGVVVKEASGLGMVFVNLVADVREQIAISNQLPAMTVARHPVKKSRVTCF